MEIIKMVTLFKSSKNHILEVIHIYEYIFILI
jgi:hypothetical protein